MWLRRSTAADRLARLGCRGCRSVSGVPRIGQLLTVRQVVDAHAKHSDRYRPPDYGASWNTLGKLVRQQAAERRALRAEPTLLEPLALATERALPGFDEGRLAIIVNGLANLRTSSGWRAGDALWAGLATHCTRCVPTMRVQELANTAHGFAKVERREPALFDAIAAQAAPRLGGFTEQVRCTLRCTCCSALHRTAHCAAAHCSALHSTIHGALHGAIHGALHRACHSAPCTLSSQCAQ